MPLEDYRRQQRGGKGVKGAPPKEEDEISIVAVTTTHSGLYLFTSKGRVFSLRGHVIPQPKTGKGRHVSAFVPLEEGERVMTLRDGRMAGSRFVFFITKRGVAKRMPVTELENITRAGRRVLSLDEGDDIARVRCTTGEEDLLLVTAQGQAQRVNEEEFRPMGRMARGVRGIRLDPGDEVVGCDVVRPGVTSLFLSENGIGKRTEYGEFTVHHRGGGGVRSMRLGDKTGSLVGSWSVHGGDEILVISARGRMVRLGVEDIPLLSRTATGPIVVRLDEGDAVVDVSVFSSAPEDGE